MLFLISHIVFIILCDTLLSVTEEEGDIPSVPRSLQLVGLNWLTSVLWLGKL